MPKASSLKHAHLELTRIRGDFGARARLRKLELLAILTASYTNNMRLLHKMHATGMFLRAFSDDAKVYAAAGALLKSIVARVLSAGVRRRRLLHDSGIAGSSLVHEFSSDAATWLSERFGNQARIAWDSYDDPERLDPILYPLLHHAELHVWDEGEIGTQEWLELAIGEADVTDLMWIIRQIRRAGSRTRLLCDMYDAAEVPVRWDLTGSPASKTFNEISWLAQPCGRSDWRKAPRRFRAALCERVRRIELLEEVQAKDVIDAARAALAVRHREVYAMTYANPQEVYLAPLGEGVHVAVIGVLPEWRFNLEGNYGYMIFSHGVPIGYGGASPLFDQANTGVNLLEEFRRGESRFLFLQVLRVLRTLFGCERFIANPYQFGKGNDEAFATGAFWFYHKLGFRPTEADVTRLAQETARELWKNAAWCIDRATMKRLISCDLELIVRPGKSSPRFDESWLNALSRVATIRLAAQGTSNRARASRIIARRVASWLGANNVDRWRADERRALERLAPILDVVAEQSGWPASAKRACVDIIRAKGGRRELDYVRKLARHRRLREALANFCQRMNSEEL